jgi:hypothetical protein
MARFLSTELPDDLYRRLCGDDLDAHAEKIIPICTVDANGWPHPALLGYLEVIAKDRRNLRLATYKDSTTTNNMRRNGKVTLVILDERVVYYIKGNARELAREMRCAPYASKLNVRIEEVLLDQTEEQLEAGVFVAHAPTYTDPHLAERVRRARDILGELLEE